MTTTKVVILNYNGEENLSRFLPSVVANTPSEVEIVVADNGSTDRSVEILEREFPTIKVVRLDSNWGFAGGYNRALREVEADYYILLNSDVETPQGWCQPLIEYLDRHPDTAAVAPKLLSYSHPSSFEYAGASGGFIDSLGYPFCRGRILSTIENDEGQYDEGREVFWATGACFTCRATVFWEMGGFDDDFFAHQEEIDLCWRMQLAGWKIAIQPLSRVYHLGAGTLPPSSTKVYLNHRNNLAMLYKNLPKGRCRVVLTLRMILDGVTAMGYFLQGKRDYFGAVWRAHRDFRRMKQLNLKAKRRVIQTSATSRPSGVYGGSIVLRYIFGRRTFNQLI
jgi:GT2 family glycosyltransferase